MFQTPQPEGTAAGTNTFVSANSQIQLIKPKSRASMSCVGSDPATLPAAHAKSRRRGLLLVVLVAAVALVALVLHYRCC